jgi:hypothetical protein
MEHNEESTVALRTTLATRFWLKTIIMAIVCIVLGVWGIWDYVVAIPRAEIQSSRASLISGVLQPALITEMGSLERDEATVILNQRIANSKTKDTQWIVPLEVYRTALNGGGIEIQNEANELLEQEITLYGNVTPPSKFDRPMQWLFILCLPFGFYYLWKYVQMKKKAGMYCLDNDGTLTTPEGIWQSGEIIDIDMSRWIAKTGNARLTWTAKVVVDNDEFVTLDDYIYSDMHLIIGALAHRFYPEGWTPLARRVKTASDDLEDTGSEEE